MATDLKAATPDTTFAWATAGLFGADNQAAASPSYYNASDVLTALLALANTWSARNVVTGDMFCVGASVVNWGVQITTTSVGMRDDASLQWANGNNINGALFDTKLGRGAAGVVTVGGGSTSAFPGFRGRASTSTLSVRLGDDTAEAFLTSAGAAVVSTQFDKSNTTLADITGLTVDVKAGFKYFFRVTLFIEADTTGGLKVAMGGTATATAIIYSIHAIDNGSPGLIRISSRQTALGGAAATTGQAGYHVTLCGEITVNAAGTLTAQFAQSAISGTSSLLVGSHMEVRETFL